MMGTIKIELEFYYRDYYTHEILMTFKNVFAMHIVRNYIWNKYITEQNRCISLNEDDEAYRLIINCEHDTKAFADILDEIKDNPLQCHAYIMADILERKIIFSKDTVPHYKFYKHDDRDLQSGFKDVFLYVQEVKQQLNEIYGVKLKKFEKELGITHNEMEWTWEEKEMKHANKEESQIVTVHFNVEDGITTIKWKDGTISQAKCGSNDDFDPEKGLAIAFMNHFFVDKRSANDFRRKWIDKKYRPKKDDYGDCEPDSVFAKHTMLKWGHQKPIAKVNDGIIEPAKGDGDDSFF